MNQCTFVSIEATHFILADTVREAENQHRCPRFWTPWKSVCALCLGLGESETLGEGSLARRDLLLLTLPFPCSSGQEGRAWDPRHWARKSPQPLGSLLSPLRASTELDAQCHGRLATVWLFFMKIEKLRPFNDFL